MRKILSTMICAIMLFTCISCASTEPEIVPDYDSSYSEEDVDLNDRTLVMGMVQDYFFEGENSTLSYINDTDLGDLAAQRLKDVESTYNCKIEFQYVDRAGETAFRSAVGGQYLFDFISEESFFLVNYLQVNAFQDLTQVESLDVFDETKWGSRYMRSSTMFDGAIIGVLPAAHPMRVSNSMDAVLVINEDLIANILATDPRDLYENGEWNWDAFENALLTYAHTDNSNERVYSLGADIGTVGRALAICNGFDFLTMKDNGKFDLGYFSENAVEGYNKAYEWYNGAPATNIDTEPSLDKFIDNKAVMQFVSAWEIVSTSTSIAYQMENFGIVPPPYGPSSDGPKDYKVSYSAADFTMCIPITAKDIEESAFILDKIYEPFEGYETREDIIDYLYNNYFTDKRDANLFIEMTEGDHAFYHDHMHGFSFHSNIKDGVAKTLEEYEEKVYTDAAKYTLTSYETIAMYEEYFHD